MPGGATVRPLAAHPGISPGPCKNHWENNGFRVSTQVEHGVPSRAPGFGLGILTVIGNHWKTIGKTWFRAGGLSFFLELALAGVYTSLLVQLPERETAPLASLKYLVNPMGKQ